MFPGVAYVLGDSEHTEYIPNPILEMTDHMSLPQRVLNTLSILANNILYAGKLKAMVQPLVNQVLPNCPPLDVIEQELSLVFFNSHPIFHYPRAKTPEMIEIGGIHCRTPQPLPLVSPLDFYSYHKFILSSRLLIFVNFSLFTFTQYSLHNLACSTRSLD